MANVVEPFPGAGSFIDNLSTQKKFKKEIEVLRE